MALVVKMPEHLQILVRAFRQICKRKNCRVSAQESDLRIFEKESIARKVEVEMNGWRMEVRSSFKFMNSCSYKEACQQSDVKKREWVHDPRHSMQWRGYVMTEVRQEEIAWITDDTRSYAGSGGFGYEGESATHACFYGNEVSKKYLMSDQIRY